MQLRDYQSKAVESLWTDLCTQPGNPLIVAPTGSGKSALIGAIASRAIQHNGRVIVVAHRKELLEQNADKIKRFTTASLGLYSAGLRRYDTESDIVCGGIQSIYNKASLFGARHLLLIDEAHLVPDDGEGMYRTFIDELRNINPKLRVVGLTATPYRTSTGALTGPHKVFQRIAHETHILPLIQQSYLCPLETKAATASYDTSSIHVRGGEFVQSELERLFADHVGEACREIVAATTDRHSVLIFCQGVCHAEAVQEAIEKLTGEEVGLVTGGTLPLERSTLLKRFSNRQLRYLVNIDVLTTGFDAPCIDAIAVLRATMSPGLFAQIVGRGLRIDPSKQNCLILDFGENVLRHGKLDDPQYGRKEKQKREGEQDAPTKNCPNCGEASPISARECACGFQFPIEKTKHGTKAGEDTLLGHISPAEWFKVDRVSFARHTKREGTGPDTLRVDYECTREEGNLQEKISEWVCFDHDGFARKKANIWFAARSSAPAPVDVTDALDCVPEIRHAARIKAHQEGRFWRIDEVELGGVPPKELPYPVHYCETCKMDVEPYKKEVPPHIGIYCLNCHGYIKWISKDDEGSYGEEIPF